MFRGTTPIVEFDLPFNVEELDCMYITITQNDIKVIEKSLSDCFCYDNHITCRLTQTDTLSLSSGPNARIQVRLKTKSGDALSSVVHTFRVDQILKDGEI